MTHTLVAFSKQHLVGATEELVTGVADVTHRVTGNDIYVGKFNKLVGLHCAGRGLTIARVSAPSLRRVSSVYIQPQINDLSYTDKYNHHFNWRGQSPLP
ncbi:unnamed protein product, partial [marine sediment metagenome]